MNAPVGPDPGEPGEAKRFLRRAIAWLKSAKEIIAIVAFFGAGLLWVVNYFATRDALEQLECFTRVNVRMLQSTANVNFENEQARMARSDLREQRRLLKDDQASGASSEDLNAIQSQIEELEVKLKSFESSEEEEKKSNGRWLAVLTGNMCYQKGPRTALLQKLGSGE